MIHSNVPFKNIHWRYQKQAPDWILKIFFQHNSYVVLKYYPTLSDDWSSAACPRITHSHTRVICSLTICDHISLFKTYKLWRTANMVWVKNRVMARVRQGWKWRKCDGMEPCTFPFPPPLPFLPPFSILQV